MKKPVLYYDEDCGFCKKWVASWKARVGDAAVFSPSPEKNPPAVRLTTAKDGDFSGAEAVFKLLALAPGRSWLFRLHQSFPPFAWTSELVYRLVASNRRFFSKVTDLLWGSHLEPPTFFLARRLFIASLGLCYFSAFASLGSQIIGLVGEQGILPAQGLLEAARSQLGARAYYFLPSVFWLGASDAELKLVCWAGAGLSALLIAGLAPGPILLALWGLYLSLVGVGRDFLTFQWDALLLETGFAALFLAPWRLWPRPGAEPPPSGAALWALRWLLFRLMLESGAVKLLSGDPAWAGLTALTVHYETQPLPTALGWWAHQLPAWLHKLSCLLMFAIELGMPWLVFMPRRPKMLAGASFLALMLLIGLTGNYTFFNLLTAALCLLLFDDNFLSGFLPRWLAAPAPAEGRLKPRGIPGLQSAFVVFVLAVGASQLAAMLLKLPPPRPVLAVMQAVSPFHLVNRYGLFAVMTKNRPEIRVEGSADGVEWREYAFKWKPGDPAARPRWAQPHQPRLDWQLWFAALGECRQNPWFVNFLARLLQNSPPVLDLMASNPFPVEPPRYMRTTLWDYRFTRLSDGGRDWWTRAETGPYCPVIGRR